MNCVAFPAAGQSLPHCADAWVVSLQVVAVVEPERERLDAVLVFPSMPAVMRLNKLGTFSLSQLGMNQKKSPIGEFMKTMRKSNDRFEESLLKLVRTLPSVLKYLPSEKAQDAKNFIQVNRDADAVQHVR